MVQKICYSCASANSCVGKFASSEISGCSDSICSNNSSDISATSEIAHICKAPYIVVICAIWHISLLIFALVCALSSIKKSAAARTQGVVQDYRVS